MERYVALHKYVKNRNLLGLAPPLLSVAYPRCRIAFVRWLFLVVSNEGAGRWGIRDKILEVVVGRVCMVLLTNAPIGVRMADAIIIVCSVRLLIIRSNRGESCPGYSLYLPVCCMPIQDAARGINKAKQPSRSRNEVKFLKAN